MGAGQFFLWNNIFTAEDEEPSIGAPFCQTVSAKKFYRVKEK